MNHEKKDSELLMLKGFARGNKEIIIKLINVFLKNTPSMLEELEKQIKLDDFINTKQAIHKLASQFTFMGFETGEKILLKLKQDFESGKLSEKILPFVNQLKTECDFFYVMLNNEVNRLR